MIWSVNWSIYENWSTSFFGDVAEDFSKFLVAVSKNWSISFLGPLLGTLVSFLVAVSENLVNKFY